MTTSSVASAATTVNSVLADTSVNHCTAGSVLERSANPTDGEASAVSLCNMSTTSHAIGDRGHGALLTPDYNDRRLGGRNNYLRNPSPLGMPTEGPIGYQRKQACVVGTRVDTSDDAFRTIKSDDQMRASTAYRALVTRFSEAWRMGSRLDMLRWRPDPRWHPDQPKYEQSYSVDQETRQDFATPNSPETKLPQIEKCTRYADRPWISSAKVQMEIEAAVNSAKDRPREVRAVISAARPATTITTKIAARPDTNASQVHSTIEAELSNQQNNSDRRDRQRSTLEIIRDARAIAPPRRAFSNTDADSTGPHSSLSNNDTIDEQEHLSTVGTFKMAKHNSLTARVNPVPQVGDKRPPTEENVSTSAKRQRSTSLLENGHKTIGRSTTAMSSKLDKRAMAREQDNTLLSETSSTNTPSRPAHVSNSTKNNAFLEREKFVLPAIPEPVSPTWPMESMKSPIHDTNAPVQQTPAVKPPTIASTEEETATTNGKNHANTSKSTPAHVSKPPPPRTTIKSSKRTVPADRANRGGKRAIPVDPALAIAMELASDRPLILDEFFARNPDLPHTKLLPQRAFPDHIVAFDGDDTLSLTSISTNNQSPVPIINNDVKNGQSKKSNPTGRIIRLHKPVTVVDSTIKAECITATKNDDAMNVDAKNDSNNDGSINTSSNAKTSDSSAVTLKKKTSKLSIIKSTDTSTPIANDTTDTVTVTAVSASLASKKRKSEASTSSTTATKKADVTSSTKLQTPSKELTKDKLTTKSSNSTTDGRSANPTSHTTTASPSSLSDTKSSKTTSLTIDTKNVPVLNVAPTSTTAPTSTSSHSHSRSSNNNNSNNRGSSQSTSSRPAGRDNTGSSSTSIGGQRGRSRSRSRSRERDRDREDRRRREAAHNSASTSNNNNNNDNNSNSNSNNNNNNTSSSNHHRSPSREKRSSGKDRRSGGSSSRNDNGRMSSPPPLSASSNRSSSNYNNGSSSRRQRSRSPSGNRRRAGSSSGTTNDRDRDRDARRRQSSRSRSRSRSRSPRSPGRSSVSRRQSIRSSSPPPTLSNSANIQHIASSSTHRSSPKRSSHRSSRDEGNRGSSGRERPGSGAASLRSPRIQHQHHSSGSQHHHHHQQQQQQQSSSSSNQHDQSDYANREDMIARATVSANTATSTAATTTIAAVHNEADTQSSKNSDTTATARNTPSRHLNLSEYKQQRHADRQPEKSNASGNTSEQQQSSSQQQQPQQQMDVRLKTLRTSEKQKLRLNYHFQLARRYNRLIERAQAKNETIMSVAYRFVMIMNEMIAFETIQQIRADESRDAILSSIPDWESSVTALTSLATDLQRSQENALSGLCYRLAVAAQQRVLDLRLRAESAVRRQQLAEASANPAQMGNDALADQLSKASIAFYRADTDDKRLEECWRAADASFTLSSIRSEFPSVWRRIVEGDSPALDPAFSPYIPIRQVVPFVWELVCEYARRHDIHDLPPMLPMEPSTSTSKSASMSSASSSSSALGGGAATTSTPRKSS